MNPNTQALIIILGETTISEDLVKIGYIIQPDEEFKSLFGQENQTIDTEIGLLEGTEKPKKRSEWKTLKNLKKLIALKRYRIVKRLNHLKH